MTMDTGILNSKIIRLRAVEPEDLDTLYEWENDPSIWHLGNTLTPFSRFTLAQYIESSRQDIYEAKQLRLIIERMGDQKSLGAIDLFEFDPHNLRAGVGILIGSEADRKKGYASEALDILIRYSFKVLMLKQLYCNIDENNTDSLELFIRHGFVITGQKREWNKTPDGWLTEYFLQLINQ